MADHSLFRGQPYVCIRCDDGEDRAVMHGARSTVVPLANHCVRIQAADLRDAARKSATIRADAAARNRPLPPVLVDIEVLIDRDAVFALNALAELETASAVTRSPTVLRYGGTPKGLAGLIEDIHILGIADGVMLLPLMGTVVIDQIIGEVLPLLGHNGSRKPGEPGRLSLPASSPSRLPA
jgi:hypothetical protein